MTGPVVLITGASRGIGAETALQLARHGATVFINYREKAKRAEKIAGQIAELGGVGIPVQADITNAEQVTAMFDRVAEVAGHLDGLILNASGGMEANKPADYAMRLNRDAQVDLARKALPLLTGGGKIVFVTSHQAHFGSASVPEYTPIAASKRAGEDALLALVPTMESDGVRFTVVTGDIIEGTITATLLDRANPGLIEKRKVEAGAIPTIPEFASAVTTALLDDTHNNVVAIGTVDTTSA